MSQVRPAHPRLFHIEDALNKTGWGLYYKFLLGFTSACLFTNGFVLLCLHFALPLSACDTYMRKGDIVNTYVAFSLGKAIGGFFLCSLSDNSGKKCIVSKTLIVSFCCCFISAFAHNCYTLYVSTFILGAGLHASKIGVKIYLAEILPASSRGFYLILPEMFWSSGYMLTTITVYFFGTRGATIKEHNGMDLKLTPWRIIFATAGGLCILMACTSALLEISPRFLLFKRRIISAGLMLKQFYAINKSKYSETFEIYSTQLIDLVKDFNINIYPEPVGMVQTCNVALKVMSKMICVTFNNYLKVFSLLMVIQIPFLFSLPGYCVLLAQGLSTHNLKVEGSNLIHLSFRNDSEECNPALNQTESLNFILLSLNVLFGQIIAACLVDYIGRKIPIFSGLVICSLSSLLMIFFNNEAFLAIVSSFLILGLTLAQVTLSVVTIESFPTAIRGTAAGLMGLFLNLTASFCYIFMDTSYNIFLRIFAVLLFVTSFLACLLPEKKRKPMEE